VTGTTITTTTTVGASLTVASQNPVMVAHSGTVNVAGSYASAIYAALGVPSTLANDGVLQAANGYGVRFRAGGTITNGSASDTKASISGGVQGVRFDIHGTGKLTNFGTISSTGTGSGVYGLSTDTIVNGSTSDAVALIAGYQNGISMNGLASTITNFATISASGSSSTGIYIRQGGLVTNGDATHTKASIIGVQFGMNIAHGEGTVHNFGTIAGSGPQGRGVNLNAGGTVINGSNSDTAAYILAAGPRTGLYIGGSPGTVSNFGTIKSAGRSGVALNPGGTVTNGSAADTKALITGARNGVYMRADVASAVFNFGTIAGSQKSAVSIYQDGQITNGSTADTVALITGGGGIYLGSGTIVNFGTVTGSSSSGISIGESASITNGDATHKNALISSTVTASQHTALYVNLGAATINNFGTIKSAAASAIHLNNGGTIANGSTADTAALIQGSTSGSSVYIKAGQTTVNNFGTIGNGASGAGGVFLGGGGSIVNGSAASTKVSILGGSGTVGNGIFVNAGFASVVNFAKISGGGSGVDFGNNGTVPSSGTVVNGSTAVTTSLITGSGNGIFASGSVGVSNFASITASIFDGIFLGNGGSVANGSAADTKAFITGGNGTSGSGIFVSAGMATVTNLATISGGGTGVNFGNNGAVGASGTVVNGSSAVTTAKIIGGSGTVGTGIFVSSGSLGVSNFGTVSGGGSGVDFGSNGTVKAIGTVVNGSTAVTTSLITGSSNGIFASGSIGVSNFASITASIFDGIFLGSGGSIANGSAADTKALIAGGSGTSGSGIFVSAGVATVTNLATISGGGTGVNFGNNGTVGASGTVVNGSSAVTTAKIIGSSGTVGAGIFISMGSVAVTNFATIAGVHDGIAFGSNGTVAASGTVVNGSASDTTAKIIGGAGGDGISIGGGKVAITNFATIVGGGGTVGNGIAVNSGTASISNFGTIATDVTGVNFFTNGSASATGTVVNGSATNTKALITGSFSAIFANGGQVKVTNFGTLSGNTAISLTNGTISSAGTVENFGSIVSNFGAGGTAIQFGALADRLILHPGASIVGKVFGGAGNNTLELASGGSGTVGSIGTSFIGFTALAVDSGTTWTLTGDNTIGTVSNAGSLTLASSASLHVTTAVDPASTGIFKLDASSVLDVLADKGISNKIQFIGTGELIVDKAANFGTNVGQTTYNGPLIQSFTTGDSIDLKDIAASATLSYTAATGLLQINNAAVAVATLKFDNAALGFQGRDDGTGHLLITHS
jgi:hypothetical protein